MDAALKKKLLRSFPYGLYVVTAAAEDEMAAGTVSWLSQASFEPPLIMVGIKADSYLHSVIQKGRSFAINILTKENEAVAPDFFRSTEVDGDKINGHAYEPGPETGAPLITELPAWIEVNIVNAVKTGDHTIFVGEIVNVGRRGEEAEIVPLTTVNTKWSYGG